METINIMMLDLNSEVSSPLDRSKHFRFTHGRPDHSDPNSFGKHSATLHTERRLVTHISTAVYSQEIISTAEWPGGVVERTNEKCPIFKTAANGIRTAELLRSTVKPQLHQAYDQVTTYLRLKHVAIVGKS